MTVAERLHNEAIEHLNKARELTMRLAGCSANWSSGVRLQIDFDALQNELELFTQYEFGLSPRERTVQNPHSAISRVAQQK